MEVGSQNRWEYGGGKTPEDAPQFLFYTDLPGIVNFKGLLRRRAGGGISETGLFGNFGLTQVQYLI